MPQTLDFTGFLGFFPSAIYKIINSFSSCQSTDFFDLVTLERSPIWGMLCCHLWHFSEQIRTESCFSFFPFGECLGLLLGGECSIQLSYDDTCRKPVILLGFWDFSLRPYIRLSTHFRVVNLQIFPLLGMSRLSLRRHLFYLLN